MSTYPSSPDGPDKTIFLLILSINTEEPVLEWNMRYFPLDTSWDCEYCPTFKLVHVPCKDEDEDGGGEGEDMVDVGGG